MKISGLDFGKGVNTNITKVYLNGKVFNDFLYINSSSFAETIKCKTVTCATPASPVEVKDGKQTKDLYVAFFPSADAAKGDECTLTVTTGDNVTYQVAWETSSAYTAGMMYALTGNIEKVVTYNIEFKDPVVKKLLTSVVSPVDINGDGEIRMWRPAFRQVWPGCSRVQASHLSTSSPISRESRDSTVTTPATTAASRTARA